MRKVKLQVQLSLDGFVGSPEGKMDYLVWNWDESLKKYVADFTEAADTMILGTVLYEGMKGYWPAIPPDNEQYAAAQSFNAMEKVVFSSSLAAKDLTWNNSRLAKGTAAEEIRELKSGPGKDIVVYGGARFVSGLIREGLIDEYHLFVNPVAIGKGLSIFGALQEYAKFEMVEAKAFACGIVVLHYRPAR